MTSKRGNDKPRIFKSRLVREKETTKISGFLNFILYLLNIECISRIDPRLELTIYKDYYMKQNEKKY